MIMEMFNTNCSKSIIIVKLITQRTKPREKEAGQTKMQIKQVFKNYEYCQNEGLGGINFCPVCGTQFELRESGEKIRPVCSECGYVYYKNPYPAVSVLIVDDNNILLGKRKKGSFIEDKWCLPCGYIEFNEDFLTAARREAREETGLEIEIDSIVNVNSNFLSSSIHSIVVVLLAHVKCGVPLPGDDIGQLMWHDMSKELPDMAFEADTHIIKRYYKTEIIGLKIDPEYK